MNPGRVRHLRLTAIALAAWSGVAVIFLIQRLIASEVRGVDPMWDRLALEMIVTWGGWAVLTPIIYQVVRRLPLPADRPSRVLFHLPIGLGVGLLHSLLVATITPLFIWRPSFLPIRDMFTGRLAGAIATEMLIYFMVAGVIYAYTYSTEARQSRIAFSRVESDRAKAELDARRLDEERQMLVARLQEIINGPAPLESLAIPERDGLVNLPLASIDWLQADDNYVRLHAAGRSHLLRTSLSALEKKLAAASFVRIHRSAMVSVSRIARLKRNGSDRYTVVLTTGAQLRVSRAYRKRVTAALQTPLATP